MQVIDKIRLLGNISMLFSAICGLIMYRKLDKGAKYLLYSILISIALNTLDILIQHSHVVIFFNLQGLSGVVYMLLTTLYYLEIVERNKKTLAVYILFIVIALIRFLSDYYVFTGLLDHIITTLFKELYVIIIIVTTVMSLHILLKLSLQEFPFKIERYFHFWFWSFSLFSNINGYFIHAFFEGVPFNLKMSQLVSNLSFAFWVFTHIYIGLLFLLSRKMIFNHDFQR